MPITTQREISEFFIPSHHAGAIGMSMSAISVVNIQCPADAYLIRLCAMVNGTLGAGACNITVAVGRQATTDNGSTWSMVIPAAATPGIPYVKDFPKNPDNYVVRSMASGTFPGADEDSRAIIEIQSDGGSAAGLARFVIVLGR